MPPGIQETGSYTSVFILNRIADSVDTVKKKISIGRVLVMDDEVMILDVAGRILTRLGYDVEFAENGEQAITRYRDALAKGRRFDLVIMDLTVPDGMGGREAVKRLRDFDPGLKAIVSSGSLDDPVMSNYAKYGFNGIVSKPYTIKTLGDTVIRVISSDINLLSP